MKIYEHKHDAGRKVEAVQVTESNTNEVADWCNGEADDTSVNVLIEGGESTKIANKGDYVIADDNGEFHVRNATVFEAKYKLSENQDEEIDFDTSADVGQEDEHGVRVDESQWAEDAALATDE